MYVVLSNSTIWKFIQGANNFTGGTACSILAEYWFVGLGLKKNIVAVIIPRVLSNPRVYNSIWQKAQVSNYTYNSVGQLSVVVDSTLICSRSTGQIANLCRALFTDC
ncbi:MAG: hypothetical protein IPN26_11860 [Bacteroidetes bacterium]|nr:hypothetical protein [Bacteroidota bacterium]